MKPGAPRALAPLLVGAGAFEIDGRTVAVIGLDALLKNKRAVGRAQDLADVEALEQIHRDQG